MDPTRAQGLLGFSSSRWMDPNAGVEPKDALDKALFEQMNKIQAKKRQSLQKRVSNLNIAQRKLQERLPLFKVRCDGSDIKAVASGLKSFLFNLRRNQEN